MDLTLEDSPENLNDNLAREFHTIIDYVAHTRRLKEIRNVSIPAELETQASEELQHALTVCKQADDLGGDPTVEP